MIYLILLVSFGLRFWRLGDWTYFGLDQEYAAYLMERIIKAINYPLIGVNASDTGLYLGPLFLYFSSIWQWLGKGNPVFLSAIAAIFGVVNTGLIYFVGKRVFNKNIGLIAAWFWAMSTPLIIWERKFWNPMWIPLLSILILWGLYQIETGYFKFIYLLAVVLGLGFSSHLQILTFVPLIIYLILKQRKFLKPFLFKSWLIFFLLFSPLIIFDISHNLSMTKSLFRQSERYPTVYLSNYQNLTLAVVRVLGICGRPQLYKENSPVSSDLPAKAPASPLSFLFLLGALITLLRFRKENVLGDYFLILAITTLLLPIIYRRSISDYYLLYMAPWLMLLVANFINYLFVKNKIVGYIIILMFSISQLITFMSSSMDYSFTEKLQAVKFASTFVTDKQYRLDASQDNFRFGGYRYLFTQLGRTPAKSYIDENLGWLYEYDQNFVGDEIYLYSVGEPVHQEPDVSAEFGKIGIAIYKK